MDRMMELVCFSDTHGWHRGLDIPDGDILIFAGDFTARYDWEYDDFFTWFANFPHRHKMIVPGNHDWVCYKTRKLVQDKIIGLNDYWKARGTSRRIYYLENSTITINGIKFWGTPVQPKFKDWAFNYTDEERRRYFSFIPYDTNVLITHCPPYKKRDCIDKKHVGCKVLETYIHRLPELKFHIFGHIHEDRGIYKESGKRGTMFINCSICDGNYVPKHRPINVKCEVDSKYKI